MGTIEIAIGCVVITSSELDAGFSCAKAETARNKATSTAKALWANRNCFVLYICFPFFNKTKNTLNQLRAGRHTKPKK